jgi:hypothetical protein
MNDYLKLYCRVNSINIFGIISIPFHSKSQTLKKTFNLLNVFVGVGDPEFICVHYHKYYNVKIVNGQ